MLAATREGAPGVGITNSDGAEAAVCFPLAMVAVAVTSYVCPGSRPLSEQVDVAQAVVILLAAQRSAPTAMACTLLAGAPEQDDGTATTINGAAPELGSTTAMAVEGLVDSIMRAGALRKEEEHEE